ncbi:hypothetical protein [Mycobacterium heckeshornense]|uniref:hypothetical protein n=1 Tax=Mycobacterium heckeshornense TaxID=110505 RepID=UPI000662A845|nr:hypothetical protein [Mycobacterium heckeshornense]
MAKRESKDEVRRKVREAQAQANRERLERESANREDMVAFLVAEQKLAAVDEWEAERLEQVRLEAEQRREEQRLEGARALARMRERGETVAGIAALGARSEKLVRSYLRKVASSRGAASSDANCSQPLGETGAVPASASHALGANGSGSQEPAAATSSSADVGGAH